MRGMQRGFDTGINAAYTQQWQTKLEQYKAKLEQYTAERKEIYWSEHPSEKADLTKKIESLEKEKKEHEAALAHISFANIGKAADDQMGIGKEIEELETRISKLGMFKGKEKRLLQEKVDKLKQERNLQSSGLRAKISLITSELNAKRDKLNNPL